MRRRDCLAWLTVPWSAAAWADPSAAERARINRLIDAVGQRKDILFVRNGKEYTAAQAADFLRGKLQWRIEKVGTVQDFIEQVGTRSTTSGGFYLVRLANGRTLTSAEFLAQELRRLERR
jgi:hypothetical protein